MAKLIGFCTKDSLYDGVFDNSGWKAAGMGYLVKTSQDKLIVIDGGNKVDAEPFFELLQKYSNTGKVTVDYWIITHPHGDHYFCLREMCADDEILSNIDVRNVIYFFPQGFKDKNGNTCHQAIEDINKICNRLGATAITPNVGETITIDNVNIEFLYVPSDYEEINNANGLSLIFTVSADKKIMFTGDAFRPSLKKVTEKYGNLLKSDILQMPHHALCDTGYLDFFKFVDAKTVVIPTCIAGYREMEANEEYRVQNVANKYAENNAHIVYKSFEGTFEINI